MSEPELEHRIEDVLYPTIDQQTSLASIAISLKRIADALEAFTKGHFSP